jgi:hypothetical protein
MTRFQLVFAIVLLVLALLFTFTDFGGASAFIGGICRTPVSIGGWKF